MATQPSRTTFRTSATIEDLLPLHPKGTDLVCSLDMDCDDQIPVGICHVLKADVSQDPSVIDENVYPSEFFYGRLDDPLAILNAVVVCYRFAASGSNLVNDNIRCLNRNESAYGHPLDLGV